MQGMLLYEYATIRILPKVEREEFINIGVILFCKSKKYLKLLYNIDNHRLSAFSNEIDIELLESTLQRLENLCKGGYIIGNIAMYETPERFRWITAVKSACLQTSRPHPGFTHNLDQTLHKLFEELVL